MSPWVSGESLSPANLNRHAAEAATAAGFSSNTLTAESGLTIGLSSAASMRDLLIGHVANIGGTPLSTGSAVQRLIANSATSNYLYFEDSSGARSNYILGSNVGGTTDGLNLFDSSGNTMIASFSKQSIRFYQNVIAPVFDVGGAVLNVSSFGAIGDGITDDTLAIQTAFDTASTVSGVVQFVPGKVYKTSQLTARNWVTINGYGSTLSYGGASNGILISTDTAQPLVSFNVLGLNVNPSSASTIFWLRTLQASAWRDVFVESGSTNNTVFQFDTYKNSSSSGYRGSGVFLSNEFRHISIQTCGRGFRFEGQRTSPDWPITLNTFAQIEIFAPQYYGYDLFQHADTNYFHDCLVTLTAAGSTGVRLNTISTTSFTGVFDNTFENLVTDAFGSVTTRVGVDFGPGRQNVVTGYFDLSGSGSSKYIIRANNDSLVFYDRRGRESDALSPRYRMYNTRWEGDFFLSAVTFNAAQPDAGRLIQGSFNTVTSSDSFAFSQGVESTNDALVWRDYVAGNILMSMSRSGAVATIPNWSATTGNIVGYLFLGSTNTSSFKRAGSQGVALELGQDLEWLVSGFANGFGYRIYSADLGGGVTNLRIAARNNAAAFTDYITLGESGVVSFGTNGTSILPAINYGSEKSLGWYRSGNSTMALSYGTLNFNQARAVSIRTTATSLASTSMLTDEMCFFVGGASGATLGLRVNGIVYLFNSSSTTKG